MNSDLLLPLLGEFLFKATAVFLLAALIAKLWRSASAAQQHFLWMAAIFIVLLLPLTRLVSPRWSISVQKPGEPEAGLALPSPAMSTAEVMVMPAIPSSPQTAPAWHIPAWQTIVTGVWLAGCVGLMSYRALGLWRLRRLEKSRTAPVDARVEAAASDVLEAMGIKRQVRVRIAEDCRVPMTWGFWRPILVLPSDAPQWGENRLAAALRHEAGHIARNDYPTRWIAHLACAVYWPNPLVWLAAKALRTAQEQATDDLVLRAGTPPGDYAAQLFDSARLVAARGIFAQHAVAMATPSTLESRVLAIVDELRDRRPLSPRAAILGVLAVATTFGLCSLAQLQAASPAAPADSTASNNAPKSTAEERAKDIIIPEVNFRDTSLVEAIEFLRQQSREHSADQKGVNIVMKAPPKGDARITLHLVNVPLIEATRYVASLANLAVDAQGEALVIGGPVPAGATTSEQPAQPPAGALAPDAPKTFSIERTEKLSDTAQPLELTADRVTRADDGMLAAEGHVRVRSGAAILTADKAQMKEKSRWVTASGNVEVTNGNTKTTGDKLVVGFSGYGAVSFVGPHKTTIILPQGIPVTGKPGFYKSPFAPEAGGIDVRGLKSGAEVKCPTTGKPFVIPPLDKGGASNNAASPSVKRLAETGSASAEIPELTKPSPIQQPAPGSPIRIRVDGDIQVSTRFINR